MARVSSYPLKATRGGTGKNGLGMPSTWGGGGDAGFQPSVVAAWLDGTHDSEPLRDVEPRDSGRNESLCRPRPSRELLGIRAAGETDLGAPFPAPTHAASAA